MRDKGTYRINLTDGSKKSVIAGISEEQIIKGDWNVEFPVGWGVPEKVLFPDLIAWEKHSDKGINYFSGTATYKKNITLSPDMLKDGSKLYLELGEVEIIAEVKVNGKNMGILWKPPFTLDITDVAKLGENTLEIEVVNNWQNRLIGDEQYPDDATKEGNWHQGGIPNYADWLINEKSRPEKGRLTFTTWKHMKKDDNLIPSGLIGPVKLRCIKPVRIDY